MLLSVLTGCAFADGESAQAALAACSARRWLARYAAGVKVIRCYADAAGCTRLVPCLPALEDVTLCFNMPLLRDDLGCLLEALAWCPRTRALTLSFGISVFKRFGDGYGPKWPFPDACVFAKLSSLTKLALTSDQWTPTPYKFADVVGALVPLTGLAELSFDFTAC